MPALRSRLLFSAGLLLAAGSLLWLYQHDPEQELLCPKCPLLLLTGWKCPGCGVQRMLFQALHGHWLAAVGYNVFLLLALPWVGMLVVAHALPATRLARWIIRHLESRMACWVYVALYCLWWMVRNLLGL